MRAIVLSVMLSVSAVAAHAESFTFTSTSTVTNEVVAPVPDQKPVSAGFQTGTSQVTWASGKTETNTANCAGWTMPPGSTFQQNGACVLTDAAGGKASIVFGCDENKAQTEGLCWGFLSGMSGARAGKSGTISWHSVSGANGKGTATGTGQWSD